MSDALAALRDGARRVNRAPAVLFGVWALTIAVTLPAAVIGRAIVRDLGHGFAADASTDRFAAFTDTVRALSDSPAGQALMVPMTAAFALVWLFLAGGIIDRYARDRATRSFGFFGACGVFFFRFLRLAIVQAIVYGLLIAWLRPWLFARADTATARLACSIVVGALVAGANLVFDYTRVRAVVEDRRSMIGALGTALGFIRRHFASVMILYLLELLLFAGAVMLSGAVAADVWGGPAAWVGIVVGESVVALRLWVRLLFWASETALFQMQLAHAGYVARPEPLWPESPAAEAIG